MIPILKVFEKFPQEGQLIGQMLTGYADIEIAVLHCVQHVREDFDTVLKAMFRTRGETQRLDIADAFGRQEAMRIGLGTEFCMGMGAARHCLKIRNQYAHCVWWDDWTGKLAFANLEEIALKNELVGGLRELTAFHVDVPLLQEQLRYYSHADRMLAWVNYETRFRYGRLANNPAEKPKTLKRPNLRILPPAS